MKHRPAIGVLLEDVSNPFSSALHRAVVAEAGVRGMQVLAGGLAEERESEAAGTFAQAGGLIIAPLAADQAHLAALGVPVVFVDRSPAGIDGDTVVSTNVAAAASAVRHLIAHGHRRSRTSATSGG